MAPLRHHRTFGNEPWKRKRTSTYSKVRQNQADIDRRRRARQQQRGPSVLGTFLQTFAAGAGWNAGSITGRNIAQNKTRTMGLKPYPLSQGLVEGHTFIVMGTPTGPYELVIISKDGHQRESVGSWPTFPEITAAMLQWETYLHDGGTLAAWVARWEAQPLTSAKELT